MGKDGLLTADEVTEYLNGNREFTKEYFLKYATPKLIEQWVVRRSARLSVPDIAVVGRVSRSCMDMAIKPMFSVSGKSRPSIDYSVNEDPEPPEVPNPTGQRKTSLELAALDEKDLFMELIRDIAYDLHVDSISHKILVNVCILTGCDRASLFLCQGHKDRQYLVSRLFDVTRESTVAEAIKPPEQAIKIPFGVGIAGRAASTGEIINIPDAYKDPRFNPSIDKDTGYHTTCILCMPIKNQDGIVIGVAQIINKRGTDQQEFSHDDEQIFSNYLTFCGIGLTNAKLYEQSVEEYKRNQVLLNLAKNIFEDTENLGTVVQRIMSQAIDLMACERCTVYIIDRVVSTEDEIVFSNIFDLKRDQGNSANSNKVTDYWQDMAEKSKNSSSVHSGFAMLVAKSGDILNIDSFSKDSYHSSEPDKEDTFIAVCMLCCPIFNNQQDVIGVAQLFNKKEGSTFDETDEFMFEGFTTFCGLGIHNTQMYEKAAILLARQRVNMEVLQYHASPGSVHVEEFLLDEIPDANLFNLYSFDFDDIEMTDHETCHMALAMFLHNDLLTKFQIPYEKMAKFILSIKKNYRPVIYHNWRHAFNVAQTLFTIFYTGQMDNWFTDLEILVLLVGALCHDLDHRGTNNNFQTLSESPIARLYGTSTMERHHFDHSVMLLKSEGSDIFTSLPDEKYKLAMSILEESILSTDLALYFKKRNAFQQVVEQELADWSKIENRNVLRGMLMTACDVAAITKPWPVQQRVAEMVASEFFYQGDLERVKFSKEPIPMMDREKHQELPKMQVGFIDFVCMQLYKAFYHINPHLKPLYDGVVNNRKHWQELIDNYQPREVAVLQTPNQRKASGIEEARKKSRAVSFASEREPTTKICVIM